MKTYFTSDLHFGCDGLIANTRPEFGSTEQHDDALIDAINRVVGRNDRLVFTGDFCFKKPGRYRHRIKCRHIFFILGNHDQETKIRNVFGGNVWHGKMVKLQGHKIWCSHYPHAFWPDSHYGSISVYGHIHDHLGYEEGMNIGMPSRRSMDVGVDAANRILGEYRPFSENEILMLMNNRVGHEELWRDIPGYEGSYKVSTHGQIRSVDRLIQHRGNLLNKRGQTIKLGTDTYGYKVVSLSRGGQKKMYKVHRLVLLTFKGPCPDGCVTLHGMAGKDINCLHNLSYGTQTENWEDRRRDGTDLCKRVRRSDGKEYRSQTEAAKDVGCLSGQISNVCYGKGKSAGGFGWEFAKIPWLPSPGTTEQLKRGGP